MEVISKHLPFKSNSSTTPLPTRCETVLKFKDRVIEMNVCLISDDSFTISDNSFDERVSTLNNETKLPVQLDIEKCFILRKPSPENGFVAETPRTSTPLIKDQISDSESSSSSQSSQGTSNKTRKSFACDICKKTFVKPLHYKKHTLMHEEGIVTIRKEDDATSRKSTATTRKKRSNPKKEIDTGTFDCNYCGKTFAMKAGVRKHVKTIHMPRKMYACDQCPKIFCSSSGLRDHRITRHSPELGMSCQGCGKTFASKQKLNCHMVSHPNHAN